MIRDNILKMQKCSVCGKMFIPAPEHAYKSAKTHKLVCSWTCARATEHKTERKQNI